MKYEYKCHTKKSTQRKWFKHTLKRSERAKTQEEAQNQVNEISNATCFQDKFQHLVR